MVWRIADEIDQQIARTERAQVIGEIGGVAKMALYVRIPAFTKVITQDRDLIQVEYLFESQLVNRPGQRLIQGMQ